jgi:hypothetical protein
VSAKRTPGEQAAAEDGALFPAPRTQDPDQAVALRHIEAYFQNPVDRAREKIRKASVELEAALARQANWRETGILSDADADCVAIQVRGAVLETGSALIRTPGFPNVELDREPYERAQAEHAAVCRYLRPRHPGLVTTEAQPERGPGRGTAGRR